MYPQRFMWWRPVAILIDMVPDDYFQAVFSRLKAYIESQHDDVPLAPSASPSSLRKTLDLKLPIEGMGLENSLHDIDVFLENSMRTHAPGFMNPLWGGLSLAGLSGEFVASATNNSMYTRDLSPIASLIEIELIRRACELTGYTDGFGTFTSGGSNGNLMGLLCARQHAIHDSGLNGFDGSKHVIFVSEESHYSVMMAANVTGLGRQNVMKIRCDASGSMDVEHLEEEIQFATREGFRPLCIIATAGTTVRGAFDPISDIVRIAKKYDIWCHVDAAWGGMAVFSAKSRHLVEGIQDSDSMCWDAHKMMGLPLVSSMFLVRDIKILRNVCAHTTEADYLFYDVDDEVDLGHFSLQCARRNDVLKLWLAWREVGDAGWARLLERYLELATYLESTVEQHEQLEMMATRVWSNVCFRFTDGSPDERLDEINAEIRERLKREGHFMVSRASVKGRTVIRSVIANNAVTEETLQRFVEHIVRIGNDISRGLPPKG
jgi:glutamate/tyrosine decarboxylase-like PLP-dependent enzyme